MLYNSHPIADLLKASVEFEKIRKRTNRNKNSMQYIKCTDCDENIDWFHKKYICFGCRQLELIELDEYNGNYTERYYDIDFLRSSCT